MMPFFNQTGLERVGVVGPDLDCGWAGLLALDRRPEIGLLLGWSAGSRCGTRPQKQERRWVGRGFRP